MCIMISSYNAFEAKILHCLLLEKFSLFADCGSLHTTHGPCMIFIILPIAICACNLSIKLNNPQTG